MRFAPTVRCAVAAAAAFIALAMAAPAVAPAQQQESSLLPQAVQPQSRDTPPPGFRITARQAERAAQRLPVVRRELRRHRRLRRVTEIPLYFVRSARRFEVVYFAGGKAVADIHVDGVTGQVLEQWTGPQAYTILARGYQPSVGRSLNRWYVWAALAVLFVAPFVDPRRPFRLLHVDLLVLLGFGVSQYYFNQGRIDVSVPLVYPLLVYLLVRTALAGFRPRPREARLMPHADFQWLVIGLVALTVFRVGLNLADSGVLDVGFSSVVGADRIAHGEQLYVDNEIHGDTYGPLTYIAYMPFELLFPTDRVWDDVPAAHAAALAFDLATVIGLMLLGARLRSGAEGRRLGVALAFAWSAYPFTLLGLQANVNDGFVAALLVFTLLALRSPARRGVMLGLATAAKFAPVVLLPLLATGTGENGRVRSWLSVAAGFGVVVALPVVLLLPDGGLREFYDCTIGHQLGRQSAFSLWGLHPSLGWLQGALKLAGLGFALALAFVPRRRDLRGVAALGAAVLIAAQLSVNHWFYFYIPWFTPFALAAMLGAYRAHEPSAARAATDTGVPNEASLLSSGHPGARYG